MCEWAAGFILYIFVCFHQPPAPSTGELKLKKPTPKHVYLDHESWCTYCASYDFLDDDKKEDAPKDGKAANAAQEMR